MSDAPGDKLFFGRYSREECGLPPAGAGRPSLKTGILKAAALFLALIGVGWLAGTLAARWRESWTAELPARAAAAPPDERSELMARGILYATALPERPQIARNLAFAGLIAAEKSPRRLGYYGNLANIFDRLEPADADGPDGDFAAELIASGVYTELNEYAKVFACIDRAGKALERLPDENARRSRRLLQVNAQAYALATAPEGKGRDPERALRLAELMITSRDELPGGGHASGSAALMDTLATARSAAGDAARALEAQTLALGLADSVGLDVYLRHYDEFAGSAIKK